VDCFTAKFRSTKNSKKIKVTPIGLINFLAYFVSLNHKNPFKESYGGF
jgi:hypothetical protein